MRLVNSIHPANHYVSSWTFNAQQYPSTGDSMVSYNCTVLQCFAFCWHVCAHCIGTSTIEKDYSSHQSGIQLSMFTCPPVACIPYHICMPTHTHTHLTGVLSSTTALTIHARGPPLPPHCSASCCHRHTFVL